MRSFTSRNFTPNNVSFGLQVSFPFFDFRAARQGEAVGGGRAARYGRGRAGPAAERPSDCDPHRELARTGCAAEVASLKQQIANEQLKTVLTQMELGNGARSGPPRQPQLAQGRTTGAHRRAAEVPGRLGSRLELAKARLNLLRALGHMEDWLNELHGSRPKRSNTTPEIVKMLELKGCLCL